MLKFLLLFCNLLSLDCAENGALNGTSSAAGNGTRTPLRSYQSSAFINGSSSQSLAYNNTNGLVEEDLLYISNTTDTIDHVDDSLEELLEKIDVDNSTAAIRPSVLAKSDFSEMVECNDGCDYDEGNFNSTIDDEDSVDIESTVRLKSTLTTTMPSTKAGITSTTVASKTPKIVVNVKSMGLLNSTKSFARRRQSNASAFQYHLYGARQRKKCKKYTEQEKYIMLERIGGRNQQFMANTADEASRNFPKLLPSQSDPTRTRLYDGYSANEFDVTNPLVDPFVCDDTCQEIRRKLGYLAVSHFPIQTRKGKFMGPFGDDHTADSSSKENVTLTERNAKNSQQFNRSNMDEGRKSKGCSLDKFITIGNCTARGDEEVLDHEKLCSACQGIFVMSSECFPSFLNAVNCGKGDGRCIFDHFTGYAQGKCMSKTLSFKVMHNRGTKDCEEWEFVYIDIPVACECFISKTSFLDTVPNEETK